MPECNMISCSIGFLLFNCAEYAFLSAGGKNWHRTAFGQQDFHSSDCEVVPSGPHSRNCIFLEKVDTWPPVFFAFCERFLHDLTCRNDQMFKNWSGVCAIKLYSTWYYIVKNKASSWPKGFWLQVPFFSTFSTYNLQSTALNYKMRCLLGVQVIFFTVQAKNVAPRPFNQWKWLKFNKLTWTCFGLLAIYPQKININLPKFIWYMQRPWQMYCEDN